MASKAKLLVIPCSGEETTNLAQDIWRILREDFNLGEQVEIASTLQRKDIESGTLKDHRHPLVVDHFPGMEVQSDAGRNFLKDEVQGKHILLVGHYFTPNRKNSVNDHHMSIRGLLDLINNENTLQRTLAVPYLPYVRSHSVEIYRKRGFYQFDSLPLFLDDLVRAKLTALLTIDPHSVKAAQKASEIDLDFHGINPFQSGRTIHPHKLGLNSEKIIMVMPRLRPFQERLKSVIKHYGDKVYFVSVDDGAERRTENFVDRAYPELPPEEFYLRIAYFDKGRPSYDQSTITFKPFSKINETSIDPEGIFIIPDDMYSSGGTAGKVAQKLKKYGAKRVEVWTSHAVTVPEQFEKANDRTHIDDVVCLDTVPQSKELNVNYIEASAYLLAAEAYKVHQKLVSTR